MGASLVSFLVGVCLAAAIRKIFGILRLYEYAKTVKDVYLLDVELAFEREGKAPKNQNNKNIRLGLFSNINF